MLISRVVMQSLVNDGGPSCLGHVLQVSRVFSDSFTKVCLKQVDHAVREPTRATDWLPVTQLLPSKPLLQIAKPSSNAFLYVPHAFFFLHMDCRTVRLALHDSFVSFAVPIADKSQVAQLPLLWPPPHVHRSLNLHRPRRSRRRHTAIVDVASLPVSKLCSSHMASWNGCLSSWASMAVLAVNCVIQKVSCWQRNNGCHAVHRGVPPLHPSAVKSDGDITWAGAALTFSLLPHSCCRLI